MIKRLTLALMIVILALPILAQDEEDEEAALIADISARVSAAVAQVDEFTSITLEGELSVSQRVESIATETIINTSIDQEIEACIEYNEDGSTRAVSATLTQLLDINLGLGSGQLTIDIRVLEGEIYLRARDASGLMNGQFIEDEWFQLGATDDDNLLAQAFGDPEAIIASFSEQLQYPITMDTVIEVDDRRGRNIDDDPTERWELILDPQAVYATGALDNILEGVETDVIGTDADVLVEKLLNGAEITLNAFLSEETGYLRRIDSEVTFDTTLEVQGESIALNQTTESEFVYGGFDESCNVQAPGEETEDDE
jgi:hypothetical protein